MRNRRKFPRFPTDELVAVTLLGTLPIKMTGRVVDLSAKGLRLVLKEEVATSTPIRVDGFNTMLLGEVCYCRFEDGGWQTGVMLEHFIWNVEELTSLPVAMSAK